jgi:acyl-CoA synthetase (AMP-forming)/AMP-acid ligase II
MSVEDNECKRGKVMTYLTDFLEQNAQTRAAKPAIISADQTLSWQELATRIQSATEIILTQVPFQSRAVISILLPISPDFVIAYWAIVRSGNMAAPLDLSFPEAEIQAITQQIPPQLIITGRAWRDQLGAVEAPVLYVEDFPLETVNPLPPLTIDPQHLEASLVFTSGTTGAPKAAPYTHANHLWNIESSTKLYDWTIEDTILLSLPLSHWHGLVIGLSGALVNGNTIYLEERFKARTTLELLASGKISLFMHVSLAYMKLAITDPETMYDLSNVRLCISASAALPPSSWLAFRDRFGLEILECYGSSEAGRIASNTLAERIPGSPGLAMPGAKVRISQASEVEVTSPGIFPGYYHNEAATARDTTPDGWWRTGDLGELDEQGRLILKGRVQEKMKKQGYLLYPRDLEWAVTRNNPRVREVFVLGVAEAQNPNDRLVYFVVGEMIASEVVEYCRLHLHRAWAPDKVIILDAIPRTRSGKPVLSALRVLASEALK